MASYPIDKIDKDLIVNGLVETYQNAQSGAFRDAADRLSQTGMFGATAAISSAKNTVVDFASGLNKPGLESLSVTMLPTLQSAFAVATSNSAVNKSVMLAIAEQAINYGVGCLPFGAYLKEAVKLVVSAEQADLHDKSIDENEAFLAARVGEGNIEKLFMYDVDASDSVTQAMAAYMKICQYMKVIPMGTPTFEQAVTLPSQTMGLKMAASQLKNNIYQAEQFIKGMKQRSEIANAATQEAVKTVSTQYPEIVQSILDTGYTNSLESEKTSSRNPFHTRPLLMRPADINFGKDGMALEDDIPPAYRAANKDAKGNFIVNPKDFVGTGTQGITSTVDYNRRVKNVGLVRVTSRQQGGVTLLAAYLAHAVLLGEWHKYNPSEDRTSSKNIIWKPDSSVTECEFPSCKKEFGMLVRRSHCRYCGGIFCRDHVKEREIEGENGKILIKACPACYKRQELVRLKKTVNFLI